MMILNAILPWLLIGVLLLNLALRKYTAQAEQKRFALLYLALCVLFLWILVYLIGFFRLDPRFAYAAVAAALALVFGLRRKIFMFPLRCRSCGRRLTLKTIGTSDQALCGDCGGTEEESEASITFRETNRYPALSALKPNRFPFTEKAVVTYIHKEGQLLLIHKKTGLGKGLINAPGGRVEAGETPKQAAIRETQEEVGLTPLNLEHRVQLSFLMKEGYTLYCDVFYADDYEGTPVSTREADPFWCPDDAVPFDRMWEDDILWIPQMLAGGHLDARFVFDENDRMLSHHIIVRKQCTAPPPSPDK